MILRVCTEISLLCFVVWSRLGYCCTFSSIWLGPGYFLEYDIFLWRHELLRMNPSGEFVWQITSSLGECIFGLSFVMTDKTRHSNFSFSEDTWKISLSQSTFHFVVQLVEVNLFLYFNSYGYKNQHINISIKINLFLAVTIVEKLFFKSGPTLSWVWSPNTLRVTSERDRQR